MSHAMGPSRESSTERQRDDTLDIATTVRLPGYYVDATQAWFRQINSTFAASRVTRPLTKFNGRFLSYHPRWYMS
jgi:hypothetical protein